MILFVLSCIYFALPAYLANMAPVVTKDILKGRFTKPLDFGRIFSDGKPCLGANKTFRGLVAGIIFAVITAYIQSLLYVNSSFRTISFYDYSNWLLFGFLLGLGAMLGDSIESFIKRRLDYGPGQKFVPWDQIDFIIGAMVFIAPVYFLNAKQFFIILIISFLLHISSNHFAFYIKLRKEKW